MMRTPVAGHSRPDSGRVLVPTFRPDPSAEHGGRVVLSSKLHGDETDWSEDLLKTPPTTHELTIGPDGHIRC